MNEGKATNSGLIIAAIITAVLGPLIVYAGIRAIDTILPAATPVIVVATAPQSVAQSANYPTAANPTSPISALPTTAPPLPTSPITGNCPYRELADEINVGNNTGACATLPLATFKEIMTANSVYSAIDALGRAFEADIRAGYQYRASIPARIPPAPPRHRVLWGSLTWVDELPSNERDSINSRIFRLWCNYTDPCIYAILDGDEFNVGYAGRGILLAEPLSDELLGQLKK